MVIFKSHNQLRFLEQLSKKFLELLPFLLKDVCMTQPAADNDKFKKKPPYVMSDKMKLPKCSAQAWTDLAVAYCQTVFF